MSTAEPVIVPKKRGPGRPRKVVPEIEVIETLEVPKKATTTRATSTKATKSPSTATTAAATKKVSAVVKPATKAPPKSASQPTKKATATQSKPVSVAAKSTQNAPPKGAADVRQSVAKESTVSGTAPKSVVAKSPAAIKPLKEERIIEGSEPAVVTPETSKIMDQVRGLPQNPFESAAASTKSTPEPSSSKSAAASKSAKDPAGAKAPSKSSAAARAPINPPPGNPSKATPPGAPGPRIPIAAMNSAIVSDISSRAGARPNASASNKLPPNYKSAARKVTVAIVAMPILLVTSYILYQRLVLGEERKRLVGPSPSTNASTNTSPLAVESAPSDDTRVVLTKD
ncbi:hypothetical protein PVAG01_02326 [Phlyctema vagabunda]|uniref:Uncharacterized protein n=1 Tax=Phlyctema vagabunda TaxID=108571 RepID=A0ABR4PQE3_9HELO